jgi:hypothetical protein
MMENVLRKLGLISSEATNQYYMGQQSGSGKFRRPFTVPGTENGTVVNDDGTENDDTPVFKTASGSRSEREAWETVHVKG